MKTNKIKKMDAETEDLTKIVLYYKEKLGNLDLVYKAIRDLEISEVMSLSDILIIKTGRPGLLIGSRGENVDGLAKKVNKKIYIIETQPYFEKIASIMRNMQFEEDGLLDDDF